MLLYAIKSELCSSLVPPPALQEIALEFTASPWESKKTNKEQFWGLDSLSVALNLCQHLH